MRMVFTIQEIDNRRPTANAFVQTEPNVPNECHTTKISSLERKIKHLSSQVEFLSLNQSSFLNNNEKLKFYIGDVRDYGSVERAMRGVNYVFHAAALKQVPSCEFFPMQAVMTNIVGSDNLIRASIANNVKKVVCLSTDKAVYPINAMGMSKAMMPTSSR